MPESWQLNGFPQATVRLVAQQEPAVGWSVLEVGLATCQSTLSSTIRQPVASAGHWPFWFSGALEVVHALLNLLIVPGLCVASISFLAI